MTFTRKELIASFFMIGILSGCAAKKTDSGATSTTNTFTCNSTPVAKGSRQFGMDILDVPSIGTYSDNLSNLKSLGGTYQTLHLNWNQIEAASNGTSTSGAFSDPSNALSALNALAASDGIKVTLRIHPADVPGKYVPSDLSSKRFNNSVLQTRFKAMLDYVFTRIQPSRVTRLLVGNELDSFNPGSDSNFWYDYPAFLFAVKTHLATNYPTIQLGYVITTRGATDSTLILPNSGRQRAIDIFQSWMSAVDLLGVTYYPLQSDYSMKSNSLVAGTFTSLNAFTGKPIHLEEVGYASSTTNVASEDLQSEFFCEVFKAWDTYQSKFPSLTILRMVDKSRTDAESVATTYGLGGNEKFIEYIRSFGLRTNQNSAKKSFETVQSELKKRGF